MSYRYRSGRLELFFVAFTVLLISMPYVLQGQARRSFTVQDDIALTQFGDIWTGVDSEIKWSPDRAFVALHLTSSSLKDGLLHDNLVIYRTKAIRDFLAMPATTRGMPPAPDWAVEVTAPPNDWGFPAFQELSWLDDSTGLAFLKWTGSGTRQLCFAKVSSRTVRALTPERQDVMSYSIRDASAFAYTVPSASYVAEQAARLSQPSRSGTGAILATLLFPERYLKTFGRGDLWSSDGRGGTRPVMDPGTGEPRFLYGPGIKALSLSHDGRRVITLLAVPDVPKQWERQYAPPYPEMPVGIHGGVQDLHAPFGAFYVSRYAWIDLANGTEELISDAPAAAQAGWVEGMSAGVRWSGDDKSVFLPGIFPGGESENQRPCFAVFDIPHRKLSCLRAMHGMTAEGVEKGYERLLDALPDSTGDKVTLLMKNGSETFIRDTQGAWKSGGAEGSVEAPLQLALVANPSSPPRFVATDPVGGASVTILDPNPSLSSLDLGAIQPYRWSDGLGREWHGLLFLPVGYEKGRKYPLVIQTHGVLMEEFAPSGEFPSAFAAQELASSGIMVLQMQDCNGRGTAREIDCNVAGYDAAVQGLAREGKVDPERVGLIGFSRTVMYVLRALTGGRVSYRAASVTDGLTLGLVEYADTISADPAIAHSNDTLIGTSPIGIGLQQWVKDSPELNVDKIHTPLRVVAKKDIGIVGMWGPYAMLFADHKPTDLVILNTNQHVINDPRVRFAAQQGNVDWFRFWLQDFEDPDPQKRAQYERWRESKSIAAMATNNSGGR